MNVNCNWDWKHITTLTLSNMPEGLYFVLEYFSFSLTIHLA